MRVSGNFLRVGAVAALLVAFLPAPPAGAAIPVRFAHGHATGVGHGFLRGIRAQQTFWFRARSGQHVRVNVVGGGPTRGVVLFPHGGQDGSPGGVVFDDTVHQTGRYRIRVTEDTMAEAWHGPARVYVTRR